MTFLVRLIRVRVPLTDLCDAVGGVAGEQAGVGTEAAGSYPGATHVHWHSHQPHLQADSTKDVQPAKQQVSVLNIPRSEVV